MTNEKIIDYAIIGAGLTGLSLAWDLVAKFPGRSVQIFEKSKGCGGRMATRRIDELVYDHGAQYIRATEASERWIQIWQKADILTPFPFKDKNAFCGKSGMTSLAKVLARGLKVNYNEKIILLKPQGKFWALQNDQGENYKAVHAIVTSPLPQALELLQASQIAFDPDLTKIHYGSALAILTQAESRFQSKDVYREDLGKDLFSICAQHLKGSRQVGSQPPSWTILMDAQWSKLHFNNSDEEIISSATQVIQSRISGFFCKSPQLKKWRYCQALDTWPRYFESPAPRLYLAGDAFGGPSLNGALRSSNALFEHLKLS